MLIHCCVHGTKGSHSEDDGSSSRPAGVLAVQIGLLSGHRWRITTSTLCVCDTWYWSDSLAPQLCLNSYKNEFIEIATKLSAVVACRCSPTQKADVARLIRRHTKKRVCCIGDGGNDVSMIQAADIGVYCVSCRKVDLMHGDRRWHRRKGRKTGLPRCRLFRHAV